MAATFRSGYRKTLHAMSMGGKIEPSMGILGSCLLSLRRRAGNRARSRSMACIVVLIACSFFAGIGTARAQDPAKAAVDAIFADLTKPASPGCALGIYRNGKVVYAKGYGLADIENSVPITPETVFDVGSLAKQFTAASIVLLERHGKLHLSDDVGRYIPELRESGRTTTILHLMNHTSGLRDYISLFQLGGTHPDDVTTDRDALTVIARQKAPAFAPGSDYQYSGSGYLLLALIVQRVSGQTLKDFAAQNIFKPLGMLSTEFRNDHTELVPKRALAYDPSENGTFRLSVPYAEENGDGMLLTTIKDLQKWDENFYSGAVGGQDLVSELEMQGRLSDGTTLAYAKGLMIGEYRGQRVVWHSGGSGGYHAYYMRFPQQHFSVACLCNRSGLNRGERVRSVADLYLANVLKPPAPTFTGSFGAQQLQKFAGIYRDPNRGDIWRVSTDGEKLLAEVEGALVELHATGPLDFEPADYPMEVHFRFIPDVATGAVRRAVIHEMGFLAPMTVEKVTAWRPGAAALPGYAGDYWSDELRATYRIAAENGGLRLRELIGADGIINNSIIPFDVLRPVIQDEFDLKGAPLVFYFLRDDRGKISGFVLNGFHEAGIKFSRSEEQALH
jgi:CubicO group peptidase (beta-lactamase class C family)